MKTLYTSYGRPALSAGVALLAIAVAFIVGCEDEQLPTVPDAVPPSLAISDATRDGNPDFFFLKPITRNASTHPEFDPGAFDDELAPEVHICAIDPTLESEFGLAACAPTQPSRFPIIYTMTSGPGEETIRLQPDLERYEVFWRTDAFNVDPETIHRVVVLADGFELGFADVVVLGGHEFRNVITGEVITMKDAHTLPIRFRIEHGAVKPPVLIEIAEQIAVSDAPQVNPPVVIEIAEAITVSDVPDVLPPVVIEVFEAITVSDVVGVS